MKRNLKRMTALVLAVVMVFSCNLFASDAGAAGEITNVTITPNAVLKSMFGDITTVTIDGKDFDINYLNSAIKLSMNVDHRISIKWTPSLVETFRLICNR